TARSATVGFSRAGGMYCQKVTGWPSRTRHRTAVARSWLCQAARRDVEIHHFDRMTLGSGVGLHRDGGEFAHSFGESTFGGYQRHVEELGKRHERGDVG